MRSLVFISVLALSAHMAWAETVGTSEATDFSASKKSHEHSQSHGRSHEKGTAHSSHNGGGSCNGETLGAFAKAGAPGTVSHLHCRVYVEAALRKTGCHIPLGGPASFANVSKVWSNCGHSTGSAPDGAIMMYSRGHGDRHYEIKYHGCYYSDFHHAECLPATQYHSGPFKLIGWCAP